MHSVSIYKRIPDFGQSLARLEITKYMHAVTQLLNNRIIHVDDIIKGRDIREALNEDLAKIVAFRDQYR